MIRFRSARMLALLVFLLAPILPTRAAPPARVVYTVSVADIPGKTFHVTARAEGLTEPTLSFAIPAWTPGYYVLANHYKNIRNLSASGPDGAPLSVTPTDKQTWQVATGGAASVTLAYDVTAAERGLGMFGTTLSETNGFVSGPAALVYVVDGKSAPCSITYRVPAGWKVASGNAPTEGDPFTFTAPDYDTLADQPADLGRFVRHDRTVGSVPVSIVLVGLDAGAELEGTAAFAERVFRVAAAGIQLFGAAPPAFPRYVFHFHLTSGRWMSGLEHRNGTVITLGRSALRARSAPSIIAHEFFHAWNVKRIRPEKLGPFDYTGAVRVKDLWWFEGVTDYYAPRLLILSGQQDRAYWYDYLARQISALQNNPARRRVTLEEASLKAWEGGSEGFGGLSYYNKGILVGLLLDIEMRRRTQNRVGLDDLMKRLLRQTETTGRGIPEGGIEAAASALVGEGLTPFFDRALRSREELPLKETLAQAGLSLRESVNVFPLLGVTWDAVGDGKGGLRVGEVLEGSAAARAGLQTGDVVTEMDGVPLARLGGAGFLQNKSPGDAIALGVLRAGAGAAIVTAILGKREERTYRIEEAVDLTPLQSALLSALTGQPTMPPIPPASHASAVRFPVIPGTNGKQDMPGAPFIRRARLTGAEPL